MATLAQVTASLAVLFSPPAPSSGVTPQLIQHWATTPTPAQEGTGNAGNAYKLYIAPTGAGDMVLVGITGPHGQTPTITDSKGDASPTAVCSADNGSGNYVSYLYAFIPTAGTTWIEANWTGGAFNPFDWVISEFNNIASVTAQGHNCQAGVTAAATLVTPTSFLPTNNDSTGGNLIYSYTPLAASARCNASGYTPASGFTLLSGNTASFLNGNGYGFQTSSQYQVQTTRASVIASMTMTGENCSGGNGDPFNVLSVALRIGPAGIPNPTTIHVVRAVQMTNNQFGNPTLPTSFTVPTPTQGNLRVFMSETPNGTGTWTDAGTVTSSDGCKYTKVTGTNTGLYMWYAQGCSPCPTCTATFHNISVPLQNTAAKFYDVENAAASSFQNYTDTNNTCSTGSASNDPNFTPSNSAGVAIGMVAIGNGPAGGRTSPLGAVYAVPDFAGITDAEFMAFGDAHGFYYYSSNAAQNWTWTVTGQGSTCAALVAAYK
jgi:hypothetical protein